MSARQGKDLGPIGRAALVYARKGFRVFPLHAPDREGGCSCGKADCERAGKHPRTRNGLKDATTDTAKVDKWWTQWPEANIGIATGRGLYVVDVDGPAGRDAVRDLESAFGPLPATLTSKTGRPDGGEHRLYRVSKSLNVRNAGGHTLGVGLDGRGDGGYIVAPPSLHESGERYRWQDSSVPIADLPQDLVDYLISRPTRKAGELDQQQLDLFADRGRTLDAVERQLLQRRAEGRLAWATGRLRSLPKAEGNSRGDAFFSAACFIGAGVGAGVLDYARTAQALEQCALDLGLPEDHQAWRSIRNGIARGAREPLAASSSAADDSSFSFRSSTPDEWPSPLDPVAFQGLAGELVRILDPHTEADPAAILVQFLVCFGNVIGRTAHFRVESDDHYANLYTVVVGDTSKARKGTSFNQARRAVELADRTWKRRVLSGGSSGEGIVHEVRDDPEKPAAPRDKRLLLFEPEFASILRRMRGQTNTLSTILRQAWDQGRLGTLTRHDPLLASDVHVSVVAHITHEELRQDLTATETANGFGNRFLWVCARRSKSLPLGGGDVDPGAWEALVEHIANAIDHAQMQTAAIAMTAKAEKVWVQEYERLADGHAGAFGAITSRGEAQVRRLALVYAALDRSTTVKISHLRAGLAVWNYCERSARYLFGDAMSGRASTILAALSSSSDGLTRTEISAVFHRNVDAADLDRALDELASRGLAIKTNTPSGRPGRTPTRWRAIANETKQTNVLARPPHGDAESKGRT